MVSHNKQYSLGKAGYYGSKTVARRIKNRVTTVKNGVKLKKVNSKLHNHSKWHNCRPQKDCLEALNI